jgi:hypothetical protein
MGKDGMRKSDGKIGTDLVHVVEVALLALARTPAVEADLCDQRRACVLTCTQRHLKV